MNQSFYANGKFLLTGEYLVLDGAEAIALPTVFGQSMTVEECIGSTIKWESFAPYYIPEDEKQFWFSAEFSIQDFSIQHFTNKEIAENLSCIMQQMKSLAPDFWKEKKGTRIKMVSDFPMNWGLGSSSTLLSMLADWANIDPFLLSSKTMKGSGYDIACAQAKTPILYQRMNNDPKTKPILFFPEFKDQLYFVYLNRKQNSREAIKKYQKQRTHPERVDRVSQISREIISNQNDLTQFENLIKEHENLISEVLNEPTIQKRLFPDYGGVVKSLGAWGGDFVLVTERKGMNEYFQSKGFSVCIPFQKIILA